MSIGEDLSFLVYVSALLLVWVPYGLHRRRRGRAARSVLAESRAAGLMEPASLHPIIDPARCLGCGTCVGACPEENVLGLVDGKARLISPANCIGHGACKEQCPGGAITLVLGTETRGVDIPILDANFQTNVPGVFVAGELGGMGLIRNAIEQGRQALSSICEIGGIGTGDHLDLLIVGAGPAGFSASLAAMERGLRTVTVEQETLGGTVAHFPRGKIVMTAPVDLPRYGRVKLRETTKEALLDFWRDVERKTGVEIRYQERVERVARKNGLFEVATTRGLYRSRAVLLAIGRRGTPRKLEVPGEEHPKVVYKLIDPEQYRDRRVMVVGGGDSALEAATSISEQPGTEVTLSYRGDAFSRAKPKNRRRVDDAVKGGAMRLQLRSQVAEITPSHVWLGAGGVDMELENDALIVCAGGILPSHFLESIGIRMETKFGDA
jgi:thioredoxin reductase/Pyruvate/2-oxoacid:ferredoxin oxidoreductase delta subunit